MSINVELFSCVGGMAEGFRRAGIAFDVVVDHGADACASYAHNLGHAPLQMDARDFLRLVHVMRAKQPVQLFVADPPCTPWSRAGSRKGQLDERDMLAVTVEIVRELSPKTWLIANVPGLDDAPNWPVVQRTIGDLRGYCIDFARLDAADYGVPQHRVRPFWFGHKVGTPCIRWPVPTHGDPATLGHPELGDDRQPWVTCRRALEHLSIEQIGKPVRVRWSGERYAPSRLDEPGKVVPSSQPGNRGATLSLGCGDHQPSDPGRPARTLTTNTHSDGALLAWPWDVPSTVVCAGPVLAPGRSGSAGEPQRAHPNAVKLSELAATILQGFPEDWRFHGKTKASRWSQIGMAMPPPLAFAVAKQIAARMQRAEVAA